MAYGAAFAEVYDAFMENADYPARTEYMLHLLRSAGAPEGILLDLGCGTGRFTAAFAAAGYETIGVDASGEMLSLARLRLQKEGVNALLLCQDMRALDLYGTVRATVSTLDTLNHITDKRALSQVFRRVALFTEPGGVFLFDVNTVYKHRRVLRDQVFALENENAMLVWQNFPVGRGDIVEMRLDIFQKNAAGGYDRYSDELAERAYETDELKDLLRKSGFSQIRVFGDMTFSAPGKQAERIYFLAKKQG